MLLLYPLVSRRLTWRQHAAILLCLLACLCPSRTMSVRKGTATTHSDEERYKQGFENQQLRVKLERIPGSCTDRYETLRNAVQRDRARRAQLERRVLAESDEKLTPQAQPNSNSSELRKTTLSVVSGSSVGAGEYFASVSVGTPPQKLFLIADTGSDLTWVKCRSSSSSSSPTPPLQPKAGEIAMNQSFDETASSSFSPLSCVSSECAAWFSPPTCVDGLSRSCGFSYSYTDKSSSAGSLAFESITLGEDGQATVVVGCGREYSGPNFDKAGGVVGLGQGPLSLASQLASQSAYANKFSYCLADFLGPSSISGSLAFGETLLQTTLKYTPLIQNPNAETFYYVGVKAVKVGGNALSIPGYVWKIDGRGNGGSIVDSGTTLAQFAKPAYAAIRDAFQQTIHGVAQLDEGPVPELDLCYATNLTAARSFPEFAIVFDGDLILEPPVENYFTEAAPGITCLAMQEVPAGSFSVVGNLLQQNFHMEFDRLHNRLGVAPADCSKLHS